MIAHIDGILSEKNADSVVIDCQGVGYELSVSMSTLAACPASGKSVKLYTYLAVREDGVELFGFLSREEKNMFLRLIGVSGVGPKSALGLLGVLSVHDLSVALVTGDVAALSRAPGIGKKTAQRIALELKDKVTQTDVSAAADRSTVVPAAPEASDHIMEAIEALTALGYSSAEAREAIGRVRDQSGKSEELIRLALRAMAGF